MTKRRIFDILIGLNFLGLSALYIYDHYSIPPQKVTIVRPDLTKANDILRRKTKIPESALNITATSSACTLFLKKSAELSMNDYANEFIDHHVDGIVKTCSGAFPTRLQILIDMAILDCKNFTRETITKECYAALIEAKTASVAAIVKTDTPPLILDSAILLHLVADRFITGELLETPERSLDLIDALLHKEPSYLSGYKIKLIVLAMSSLNSKEYAQEIFEDTLADVIRLDPKDRDLVELTLIKKSDVFKDRKNPTAFLSYLEEESAKHPKEWIYDYYKAHTLYNNGTGDHAQAVALIEKTLNKAPTDKRLNQTLENLNSDDEEKRRKPFIISINFSLNDL